MCIIPAKYSFGKHSPSRSDYLKSAKTKGDILISIVSFDVVNTAPYLLYKFKECIDCAVTWLAAILTAAGPLYANK